MENDLISRSALLLTIRPDVDEDAKAAVLLSDVKALLRNAISNAPAVDAVEVVRCKDCEFFEIDEGDFVGLCKCGGIATNYGGEIYPEEDFFCAYGERRNDV